MPITLEQCQQTIDAIAAHGGVRSAARALGISIDAVRTRRNHILAKGLVPEVQAIPTIAAPPEGYKVKGTSTLFDDEGHVKLQWVKTDAALEKLREMQEAAFRGLCANLVALKPINAPIHTLADLLNLYTITDVHVGMLAWERETGEPWDLEIAEQCLVDTFLQMIAAAPAAETGIVNQLGDFLHFDSLQALTPANHNLLDVDSRYQKVVEVAVRILRRIISAALEKHARVIVYLHEGNHDPAGSVWLRVMFAQLYADNPRVHVEQSPSVYVSYLHGKTMLAFHHGHMTKLVNLPQIFAAKFREQWGAATHTYIHTGHKHHVDEKEHPGCNVIQHATLAAPDAYAARGGWLSKRQATSMTYHKTKGEIARGVFVPVTP